MPYRDIMSDLGKPKRKRSKYTDANRDHARNPQPGIPLNKEQIKDLLIKHKGNVTLTSKAYGCARQTVTHLIAVNADLKELVGQLREAQIDEVEDCFIDNCLNGDTTSQIFFLKTRGRPRGYDQDFRADIEGITRAALQFAINSTKNPAQHSPAPSPPAT